MAFKMQAVAVEAQTSTGTQDITISGFGTPVAALFYWTRRTGTLSTSSATSGLVLGMGATDGTNQWWSTCASQSGQGTTNTFGRGATDGCVGIINHFGSGTVNGEADFDSWITDGVRIDWTNAASTDYQLICVLIGGDTKAFVGTHTLNTTVGGTAEVNTGTIEPNAVLLASHRDEFNDTTTNPGRFTIGFSCDEALSSQRQQVCMSFADADNVGTTELEAALPGTAGSARIYTNTTNADGNDASIEVTEYSPSGNATSFEIAQRAATGRLDFGFLALEIESGMACTIGNLQSATSTGDTTISGLSGLTKSFMRIATRMTNRAGSEVTDGKAGSIGFAVYDDENDRAYAINVRSEDAVGTSSTNSRTGEASVIAFADDNSFSTDVVASISSTSATGWVENYSQVDSTAYWLPTIAFYIPSTSTNSGTANVTGYDALWAAAGLAGTTNSFAPATAFLPSRPQWDIINAAPGYTATPAQPADSGTANVVGYDAVVKTIANAGTANVVGYNAEVVQQVDANAGTANVTGYDAIPAAQALVGTANVAGYDAAVVQQVDANVGTANVTGYDAVAAAQALAGTANVSGDTATVKNFANAGTAECIGYAATVTQQVDANTGTANVTGYDAIPAAQALAGTANVTGYDAAVVQQVDANQGTANVTGYTAIAAAQAVAGTANVVGNDADIVTGAAGSVGRADALGYDAAIAAVTVGGTANTTGYLAAEALPAAYGLSNTLGYTSIPGTATNAATLPIAGYVALWAAVTADAAAEAVGYAAGFEFADTVLADSGTAIVVGYAADAGCDISTATTDLDDKLIPKVLEIITRLGKSVTFTEYTDSYSAATGVNTRLTATYVAKCAPPNAMDYAWAEDTLVEQGQVLLYLPSSGLQFTPTQGMLAEYDSTVFTITRVRPIFSGQQIVLYELVGEGRADIVPVATTTDLDDKLTAKAVSIIDELGKTLTFKTESSTYDPTTGQNTIVTTEYTSKATPPDNYNDFFVDGSLIEEGDARTFVPGLNLGFIPHTGMQVEFDSTTWDTIRVRPIYSGEQIALYELQLRGGGELVAASVSTELDTKLLTRVDTLVTRLGKEVQFVEYGTHTYNPATGGIELAGATLYDEFVTPPFPLDKRLGGETLQRTRDLETFLPAEGLQFTPFLGQAVIMDCERYSVTKSSPIRSGEQVVLYRLMLRK